MGERKVLNKYIPADFDPALVPRGTKLSKKDGTVPVRMMLPFSIQCDTCQTFMYRGRKFNSKKEAMGGSEGRYLGIQRWRFYIKCTHCSRTVTFLTDPQNADYEMESGATRNYEVYKDKEKTEEKTAQEQEEDEKIDPMKALENRVLASQREMADLDNLEEIRAMNRRHLQLGKEGGEGGGFGLNAEAVLKARESKQKAKKPSVELNEHGVTAEEEDLVKSIKFGRPQMAAKNPSIEEDKFSESLSIAKTIDEKKQRTATKPAPKPKSRAPIVKVKRKRVPQEKTEPSKVAKKEAPKESTVEPPKPAGLAGLLGNYGSDSDSD